MDNEQKIPVMKRIFATKRYTASVVCILVGLCIAITTLCICIGFAQAKPYLTFKPDVPLKQLTSMMDAICAGDYQKASSYALGNPDIGADREADNTVGKIIWDAFVESTDYTLSGECYATEDGIAQDITFTCLDVTSITSKLRERSQEALKQRVDAASDVSEIYDKNNNYRADVVNEVLEETVQTSLKEDARTITTTVTVRMRFEDGRWWVVLDQELLDTLFGDVLFY